MSRHFPEFGRRVSITEARSIAVALEIGATLVVGETSQESWGHMVTASGLIVLRRRVPRYVVVHELAHYELRDRRVTCHGLAFIERYIDMTYKLHEDAPMARAMEAAMSVAK
jgi:hypothetical protein